MDTMARRKAARAEWQAWCRGLDGARAVVELCCMMERVEMSRGSVSRAARARTDGARAVESRIRREGP